MLKRFPYHVLGVYARHSICCEELSNSLKALDNRNKEGRLLIGILYIQDAPVSRQLISVLHTLRVLST